MELNVSKRPLITVIIAVFNRKKSLRTAINSVLSQTYNNFEIIIVDDGSSDNPEKYIFKLIEKGINIKYIKHSNRGTPLSLNAGIKLSSGNFITFLDSDDRYMPEHLELRVRIFNKLRGLDLIHTTAEIYGSENDMLIPDARNPKKLINIEKCIIGATIFGKKKVFETLKGFRDIYGYDFDFINRCRKKFRTVRYDLPTYIYYRNSTDSILSKKKIFYESK